MATQEQIKKAIKEKEEAEKKNPLSKLGLGDLEKEKSRLEFRLKEYAFVDNELSVPSDLRSEYAQYQLVIQDLNKREEEYTKIPSKLRTYG